MKQQELEKEIKRLTIENKILKSKLATISFYVGKSWDDSPEETPPDENEIKDDLSKLDGE